MWEIRRTVVYITLFQGPKVECHLAGTTVQQTTAGAYIIIIYRRLMLLGSSDVQMGLWKHPGYNLPQKQLRVPSATRSPETARPRQVPTQQPSRSPAKERASQPNSASDDFFKVALPETESNHYITSNDFLLAHSAVERSILDNKQSVSSNPPVSAFLLLFLLYVSSNPLVSAF